MATKTTVAPTEALKPGVELIMAEIEKGQQLAGHFPNAEALDRARRVYTGELTTEDARAELDAKYARG